MARRLADVAAAAPPLVADDTFFVSDEAVGYSSTYDRVFDRARDDLADDGATVLLSSQMFDTSSYARVDLDQFTVALVLTLVPTTPTVAPAGDPAELQPASPNDYLQYWLLTKVGIDLNAQGTFYVPRVAPSYLDYSEDRAQVEWFEGLDASARDEWLATHREPIAAGTLTWADFG